MSSAETLAKQLMVVMKDVSMALDFDNADRIEDAYKKYLEVVLRVATSLLKTLHADVGHLHVAPDIVKLINLGQQCMDRAANIIRKKSGGQTAAGPPKSFPSSLEGNKNQPSKKQKQTKTSPWDCVSPVLKDKILSGKRTPGVDRLSPVVFSSSVKLPDKECRGSVTTTEGKLASIVKTSYTFSRGIAPLEVARRQNQQLLSAFRRRQNLTTNKSLSTTLSLTMQRKMAENLAIAHAQETALAKKIAERQARLEEQATKRFNSPIGMSEEEQKQRHIYRRVLELEMEQVWLAELRKRLDSNPTDIEVISEIITSILSCQSHPLTEELEKHQNRILDKLTPLVKNIDSDLNQIQRVLESDVSLDLLSLEAGLDSKHQLILEGEQQDLISPSDQHNELENTANNKMEEDIKNAIKTHDVSSNASTSGSNIVSCTLEMKSQIKKSLEQGEEVTAVFQKEDEMVKTITRNMASDYLRYSQENMDDLFDSDDDEAENDLPVADDVLSSSRVKNADIQQDDEHNVTEEIELSSANRELIDDNDCQPDKGPENNNIEHGIENISKKDTSYNEMEYKIFNLRTEAYHRHLSGITEEIMTSIDTLQLLFVVVFESLDSPEGRDQCNVLIEQYFFRPLWQHLLTLFRMANKPKEMRLAKVMRSHAGCGPDRFSVRAELCLSDQSGPSPYQSAVQELHQLCQTDTMMNKLDRLVKASKEVMQCVEMYYRGRETSPPSIGADDLLPVLSFIIVRSSLPQLVSECHAIEKFIHEAYMLGEEGYCLTSFQTALNYLVTQGMTQDKN
ncbi:VPS9 domain-containing protein 1-like [Dreissena polymorpha]|uniref:VPS9 domain-containing protein n=1 Tax=Dreissena polymorpha TaxID=45954 RepID=A0A9D4IKU5_DREPO|nr:VPS9 domain-containing protein 1-like [Dreissena polymorpha]KAH3776659.1 hypothetical protein DPMN_178090 [Dreissena polymorpha]